MSDDWEEHWGTLDDMRIFGPITDFECACGKYRGENYQAMICDRCGVKVTTIAVQRKRFGHIEFEMEVRHPFGGPLDVLAAWPVLPVAFTGSSGGTALSELYEELITASQPPWATAPEKILSRLTNFLLPVAELAYKWNFQEAPRFVQALALIPKIEPA